MLVSCGCAGSSNPSRCQEHSLPGGGATRHARSARAAACCSGTKIQQARLHQPHTARGINTFNVFRMAGGAPCRGATVCGMSVPISLGAWQSDEWQDLHIADRRVLRVMQRTRSRGTSLCSMPTPTALGGKTTRYGHPQLTASRNLPAHLSASTMQILAAESGGWTSGSKCGTSKRRQNGVRTAGEPRAAIILHCMRGKRLSCSTCSHFRFHHAQWHVSVWEADAGSSGQRRAMRAVISCR